MTTGLVVTAISGALSRNETVVGADSLVILSRSYIMIANFNMDTLLAAAHATLSVPTYIIDALSYGLSYDSPPPASGYHSIVIAERNLL
jgi:hypothetical protein